MENQILAFKDAVQQIKAAHVLIKKGLVPVLYKKKGIFFVEVSK